MQQQAETASTEEGLSSTEAVAAAGGAAGRVALTAAQVGVQLLSRRPPSRTVRCGSIDVNASCRPSTYYVILHTAVDLKAWLRSWPPEQVRSFVIDGYLVVRPEE
eukprot:COSAG02_NODE_33428_length_500_cov_0.855362_2_plen_104_part_01